MSVVNNQNTSFPGPSNSTTFNFCNVGSTIYLSYYQSNRIYVNKFIRSGTTYSRDPNTRYVSNVFGKDHFTPFYKLTDDELFFIYVEGTTSSTTLSKKAVIDIDTWSISTYDFYQMNVDLNDSVLRYNLDIIFDEGISIPSSDDIIVYRPDDAYPYINANGKIVDNSSSITIKKYVGANIDNVFVKLAALNSSNPYSLVFLAYPRATPIISTDGAYNYIKAQ